MNSFIFIIININRVNIWISDLSTGLIITEYNQIESNDIIVKS